MKKRILIFAAALLICMSLAGCAEQREFIKDENFSQASLSMDETTAATDEANKRPEGTFTFAKGIQMGMTIDEVQRAIGQVPEMHTVSNPTRKSFYVDFSGVFMRYFTTKSVTFLFEPDGNTLKQIQFRCSSDADGASPADAAKLFDERYGKQAVYQGRYANHIWFADKVYVVLSEINANQYAVTYTEKAWFEKYYQEEVRAYGRVE